MATSVIKPVHAGIDLSFTIPVSGWSTTAPYTYTWTDSRVTSGCRVEAGFFSGTTDTSVAYLEYEKVTGGVQFTSPVLPTVAIPVIVHIINAQAGNTTSITGDMVQTSAISGAANVDEALSHLYKYNIGDHIPLPLFICGYASATNTIRFYLPVPCALLSSTECTYVADFTVAKIANASGTNVSIPSSPSWTISKSSSHILQIAISNCSGLTAYALYSAIVDRSNSNGRILINAPS